MLCRCDLNDLWLISSRTCFYFVLLPVELKSNRTWNRRITAYYSTRIFLYFTVIACVNIFCLCTSLVHFCGKPDLIGVCPFWHTAIWQIDIIIFVVYYNASYIMYQQVAVRCCPVAMTQSCDFIYRILWATYSKWLSVPHQYHSHRFRNQDI